jgi:SAM-dependent methyltransferase
VLGRALGAFSNRVVGYTINIAGSLVGIVAFSAISFAGMPPVVWFLAAFAGAVILLKRSGRLFRVQLVTLAAAALLVGLGSNSADPGTEARWSPYYMVRFEPSSRHITVNTISHQQMVGFDQGGPVYSLVHLLNRDSGAEPFEDALIIGAGSGNDVAHALKNGVQHVDAVEIDPVIYGLGKKHHPDRPYDDPRVSVHLDDGRNFLHRTDRKYDVATYALVDSLILHSSYSNIRLESFLFTKEAFQDVRGVLKPGGVFVMYNYFRQGWIVERMACMIEEVFGTEPIVLSLPFVDQIGPQDNQQDRLTVLIAGDTDRIAAAFREHGQFWLSRTAAPSQAVNGFRFDADGETDAESPDWLKIAPAHLVRSDTPIQLATDDWPFLYLRSRMIPWLSLRGIAVIGGLALVLLFALSSGRRVGFNGRMFFLGAAFLLLETKAVVHLALLFGSTWLVNSLVFFAILLMILASNLYVLKVSNVRLWLHYAGLFALMAINCLVPLEVFLAGSLAWKYVASCLMVFLPVFFAGVIFARSFRDSRTPDQDFGSNIAGAVMGGLAEYSSMLLGFRYVLVVAMVFYALSALFRRGRSSLSV